MMTLDDLIEELTRLSDEGHGNLSVVTDRNQEVTNVEFSEDDPPTIVVEFA